MEEQEGEQRALAALLVEWSGFDGEGGEDISLLGIWVLAVNSSEKLVSRGGEQGGVEGAVLNPLHSFEASIVSLEVLKDEDEGGEAMNKFEGES